MGLAIDQSKFRKHYSLTPYYFWPKTEAWEQLKLELDSKLWLTKKKKLSFKIARNVMEYWLSSIEIKNLKILKQEFKEIKFVTLDPN